jgi:predicted RecB family nuclease
MPPVITSEVVVAYAQCPRKAYLLLFSPDKGEPQEYVELLKQQRCIHQERYIDHLKHTHPDVEPYSEENLRKGSKMLINVHLQADGFVTECALLSRVEGTSTFGKHSYEPLLCVGTHSISKEQKLELSFVRYVLARLHHTSPAAGRIIGLDGKSHTITLGESSASLTSLLASLLQWTIVPSPQPPPVILNRHCSTCQFQRKCRAQAIQEDHLSLLGGLTPKEIRTFNNKGIFTINQLSYTFRPRRIVSVNSFLDTFGPKIRLHQPRYNVAHVSPGQGLCIRAAQSAKAHCIDAETHAAPSGVLPRYQRSGAITDSP